MTSRFIRRPFRILDITPTILKRSHP